MSVVVCSSNLKDYTLLPFHSLSTVFKVFKEKETGKIFKKGLHTLSCLVGKDVRNLSLG